MEHSGNKNVNNGGRNDPRDVSNIPFHWLPNDLGDGNRSFKRYPNTHEYYWWYGYNVSPTHKCGRCLRKKGYTPDKDAATVTNRMDGSMHNMHLYRPWRRGRALESEIINDINNGKISNNDYITQSTISSSKIRSNLLYVAAVTNNTDSKTKAKLLQILEPKKITKTVYANNNLAATYNNGNEYLGVELQHKPIVPTCVNESEMSSTKKN